MKDDDKLLRVLEKPEMKHEYEKKLNEEKKSWNANLDEAQRNHDVWNEWNKTIKKQDLRPQ